ncbi:hypothetical protein VN12_22180 [Pirellula sp. SH-Sr6A]|uniref:YhaN family protein n=1 Tax=Pirellula sp. SH-Sr6A TaxID=1632865 RepID=UPI00078D93BD|nr:YhaN family protein [Pirellula sp. SH-Sr6A]AMV34851.1 hypothetical protein VN12_22180 [Pirellula sp. SH-Sr6A]
MKLLQLDLLAVGPFTQVSLDFSKGNHGLHLVFGPNEAGKSSALRAITDFFYGFPSRTSDDFLHPYKNLRVGGTVCHSDGTVQRLVRRKGNQNTLRDESDTSPVSDEILRKYLGDVERGAFETMFGINHESLRQGGQDLVAGGGEIGEALFASAAGLSELRSVQAGLSEELQSLFKPHGPGGTLGGAIKAYDVAREKRKRSLVSSEVWENHRAIMSSAERRREETSLEIQRKQGEILRWKRILRSIPLVASWKNATDKLAAESDVPLLDEDFGKRAQALLIEWKQNETRLFHLHERLAEIEKQLGALPDQNELLLEQNAVEELKKELGVHLNAQSQLPRLISYRDDHEHKIRQLHREIGRPVEPVDMETLRSLLSRQTRIQELGNKKEGHEERLRATQNGLKKLRLEIQSAESQISRLTVTPHAPSLHAVLRKIARDGDLEEELTQRHSELDVLRSHAESIYAAIDTPKLEWKELLSVDLPSRSLVELFENEERAIAEDMKRIDLSIRDLEQAKANCDQKLALLEAGEIVLTLDDLKRVRENRDNGWRIIKKELRGNESAPTERSEFLQASAMQGPIDEVFEAAMHKADDVSDALRKDADRVAAKTQLHIEKQGIDVKIQQQRSWMAEAEASRENWNKRWKQVWDAIGIPLRSPREAKVWLDQIDALRRAHLSVEQKQRAIQELELRSRKAIDDLIGALRLVDGGQIEELPASLFSLLDYATKVDEGLKQLERDRSQCEAILVRGKLDLEKATVDVQDCQATLDQWIRDWGDEMGRLKLPSNASPLEASQILHTLEKIRDHETQRADYHKRIIGIERDSNAFLESLHACVARIAPEGIGETEDLQVRLLAQKIQKATSDAEERRRLKHEQSRIQQDLVELRATHEVAQSTIQRMLEEANVSIADELLQAAERSNGKRIMQERLRTLEESLRAECGLGDFSDFLSEVEHADEEKDGIEPRIQQLASEIMLLETEKEKWVDEFHREKNALDQLLRQEDVLDAAADCESLAATIEEQFRELMVLRICSHVLSTGMERFREKNQGPLLKAAGDAFHKMTLGAYDGLRVDWDEAGKAVMVGVRRGQGDDLHVKQMSDGTCDQLYLALRLACLENWLMHHEPIPFIVDDILVHFDDARSAATLEQLAGLSERTQVIFFTHHEHLLELAQATLPAHRLCIHRLGRANS